MVPFIAPWFMSYISQSQELLQKFSYSPGHSGLSDRNQGWNCRGRGL